MTFEGFYLTYPRKIGKAAALKKYNQAIKKGFDHVEIIEGARRFRDHVERIGTPSQYIPHPETWIHNERWADDLAAEGRTPDGREGQVSMGMAAAVKIVQKEAGNVQPSHEHGNDLLWLYSAR